MRLGTTIGMVLLCAACGARGGVTAANEDVEDGDAASPAAACAEYVEAAFSCYEQAYPGQDEILDEQWNALEDYCATYDAYSGAAWVGYFECLEHAYDEAACDDPDGAQQAVLDSTECALPETPS